MNLRADAHRSKDKRARGLAATLTALAVLLISAPLAAAQGVDQYQPSPPPQPAPPSSEAPGGTGGGSGGGVASVPSSGDGFSDPGAVPVAPDPSSTLDGGTVSSSAGGTGEQVEATRSPSDAADKLEADPLSVAANRPALALGAHASPGGLGTLPLLLGAVAIVAVAALVARRGLTRPRQGPG